MESVFQSASELDMQRCASVYLLAACVTQSDKEKMQVCITRDFNYFTLDKV